MMITENAVRKVRQLMERDNKPGHALRVAVRGGGCSGFEYDLTFDEAPQENDQVLDFSGLKVFVDGMSYLYLEGVTIDYLDSLTAAGFKISNPKATGSCGCGQSFSM